MNEERDLPAGAAPLPVGASPLPAGASPLPAGAAPPDKPVFGVVKRLFDIAVSFFGLIILSPVFLAITIMIKKQSPGKVIYKSTRLGKNGKPFRFYKFRTMIESADKSFDKLTEAEKTEYAEKHKITSDPRIYKGGEILRRTGLDELPQFFNILKGDMSFIGPRPILPEEKNDYGESFETVFSVRPGISGWWQVNMDKCEKFADKIPLDLWYINNRSVRVDLKIIFMTLRVLSKRKGSG
jgi:lipopolysaccharide/colanic/teichoic acid biosynthesis glycosyltransferase